MAEVDYQQLIDLPYLCRFVLNRGDRDDPRKRQSLVLLDLEPGLSEYSGSVSLKQVISKRVILLNLIRKLNLSSSFAAMQNTVALDGVLKMLP